LETGSPRLFAGFAANLDAASGAARECRGAQQPVGGISVFLDLSTNFELFRALVTASVKSLGSASG
jgi:hypothetical protein